jgi:hypothetical protein
MTSADAAAITVSIFIPAVLIGRYLVRRSRGQALTGEELATAGAGLGMAAAFVGLTRAPVQLVTLALPSAMTIFGVALLWLNRDSGGPDQTRRVLGLGAVVAGVGVMMVALVRIASGG